MNRYDFSGRTAVVTGGGNGIGAAVTKKLVASGAKVCIWDMNPDDCEAEVNALPADAGQMIQTDVSDYDSVSSALAQTKAIFGGVDVLVNSAGIAGPTHTLADYPVDQWRSGAGHQSGWNLSLLQGGDPGYDHLWLWPDCQYCFCGRKRG